MLVMFFLGVEFFTVSFCS